ncbi:hypothetical protein C3747_30g228 [Trypanosoma cruzi]|uniref:Uncharacterized protein n=1 Tax=Trypanosoma cruzi TaxID=5693 RepID=A0A2V2X5C9_TRYCR|nr:hypothetical protein C3747_30g228 [Trypanosoma cruzi]
MVQAQAADEAAHEAHTSPHQETSYFEPNSSKKGEENEALRCTFIKLFESRVEKLGASPSPRWRYLRGMAAPHPHPLESVVLRTDLRTAPCLGSKQTCSSFILCVSHVPRYLILLLLHAALLWFLVTGKWIGLSRRMNLTWPSATLRSAQPLAPDNTLNEFLHRLGPVAHGTLRTMIHKSFANGSLPGSWNTVDNISIPQPEKDPCRPESYRPIKSLSVLPKLTEGMIHRRLSALLPHHPR